MIDFSIQYFQAVCQDELFLKYLFQAFCIERILPMECFSKSVSFTYEIISQLTVSLICTLADLYFCALLFRLTCILMFFTFLLLVEKLPEGSGYNAAGCTKRCNEKSKKLLFYLSLCYYSLLNF